MTLDGIYFDAASVAIDFAFIESLTLTKSTKSVEPMSCRWIARRIRALEEKR